jgi:hypothetical protein
LCSVFWLQSTSTEIAEVVAFLARPNARYTPGSSLVGS